MGKLVLVSENDGVYLGYCMGLAFWSKLDACGQEYAPCFDTEGQVMHHISGWENCPEDLYVLAVDDPFGPDEHYAHADAVVAAGEDPWWYA